MVLHTGPLRRPTFLPKGVSAFFHRRLIELGGFALLVLAGLLALALVSYAPGDPSFNTASGGPVVNLAGSIGAHAADLVLQTIGAAGGAAVALLAAWAWVLISHRRLRIVWLRLMLAPFGVTALAVGLAALSRPSPDG